MHNDGTEAVLSGTICFFYYTDASKIIHRTLFCVGWVGDSGGFADAESPDPSGHLNMMWIMWIAATALQ